METLEFKIEKTNESDRDSLTALLSEANLPNNDLPSELENFLIIRSSQKIIGSIGLEVYGQYALLRSLVVHEAYRNQKLGNKLYESILKSAKESGVREIYLITTTAKDYFAKKGFQTIDRDHVPQEIKQTGQFASVCPSTALVMHLKI